MNEMPEQASALQPEDRHVEDSKRQ